jgi:ubiquinone/menaquinone biosynthesis C-methylase UbiE
MSLFDTILMRMFGRPRGVLGRLGGVIMARMNRRCAAWVIDLLEVQPHDRILEVGCGPGVGIELLAKSAPEGYVAGVDASQEMVAQAKVRNAQAITRGRVDLRYGCAESLPFDDNTFNKTLAVNSTQVWTDVAAGLREIRRVMQAGGKMALGFTPYSGQRQGGLTERLTAAGLTAAHVVETDMGFCVLAIKP